MPNFQVLSNEKHRDKGWIPYRTYEFASKDAVAPLAISELTHAISSHPLCFVKHSDTPDAAFMLSAMQSFAPNTNIYLDHNANYTASYIPAYYRAYPFTLVAHSNSNDQFVLCIDIDYSGITTSDEANSESFFTPEGKLSQKLSDIASFLQQRQDAYKATQKAVDTLDRYNLITPWHLELSLSDGKQTLKGLFKINEQALQALDGDALKELNSCGALSIAYAQLLATNNLEQLRQRYTTNTPHQEVDVENFFNNNDTIKF